MIKYLKNNLATSIVISFIYTLFLKLFIYDNFPISHMIIYFCMHFTFLLLFVSLFDYICKTKVK